jgi:S-DNA-T family DNA segregation ATPase FtsK/SpoIIIE
MSRRRKQSRIDLSLDPETRRGLAVVGLFAFAIILLLGYFDLAGSLGQALDDGVSHVFGWDKLVLPFMFMAWGYSLLAPDRFSIRPSNVVGIFLFFLTLNPLVHTVSFEPGKPVADAALAVAGGKLGEMLAMPLGQLLGSAGAITLASAGLIVAFILMFNATLAEVLFLFRWVGKGLAIAIASIQAAWQKHRDARAREVLASQVPNTDLSAPVEANEVGSSSDAETEEEAEEDEESDTESESETEEESEEEEEAPAPVKKPKRRYPRVEIPLELLERRDQRPTSGDITHNREVIRRTLDTFGIPVEMGEVAVGPTVTQFTFKPSDGVKLARIIGLHNDLALALAAHPIRIEAPIPGKSLVGVEVPNQSVATVGIREIIDSKEFRERKNPLTFVLGKDVSGKPWVADLARMPHLLVAGATGSGKSVCLNAIIMSFLYTAGPDDVKFIMVDPKRVELQIYNGIPHLVTPVITRVPETINALKWALREMDRRYDLLSKFGARNLVDYNLRVQDKLSYLVIIIDELADLMATSAAEIEGPIVRLAQMSRAVGIHLILATQRPSVNVITGLIKANIPGRIAFAVASAIDSRTILDQQGAEKLIGRGDMLFSTAELGTPKRVQGAFLSDLEIGRVVEFIKSKYDPADYDHSVTERAQGGGTVFNGSSSDEDSDELLPAAKDEILRAGKASASLLQRRLKVGYARAARILDLLEQEGFIGPADGAKPRDILKADLGSPEPIPTSTPAVEDSEEEDEEESDNEDEV